MAASYRKRALTATESRGATAAFDPSPPLALCTSGWLDDCIRAETVNCTSTDDRPLPLRRSRSPCREERQPKAANCIRAIVFSRPEAEVPQAVHPQSSEMDAPPSDEWLEPWLPELQAAAGSLDVLELGCDTGRDTLWLVNHGFGVVATDISADGLHACAALAPAARLLRHDLARPMPFRDGGIRCRHCQPVPALLRLGDHRGGRSGNQAVSCALRPAALPPQFRPRPPARRG